MAPPASGLDVAFEDVWCGGDQAPALRGVSFTLEAGRASALVGRRGAGKSACAEVLSQSRPPAGGRILIGGIDIAALPAAGHGRLVAHIGRDEAPTHATLAETISRNFPRASLADVREAARAARIDALIAALPRGYDTPCVEDERPFPLAFRRGLAVARAFLQDAPILILEETQAEDPPCLAQAIETLRQGRTVLVVTHRPATMSAADWIIVLEDGRVVEEGRHAQLLAWNDRYARLVRSDRPA